MRPFTMTRKALPPTDAPGRPAVTEMGRAHLLTEQTHPAVLGGLVLALLAACVAAVGIGAVSLSPVTIAEVLRDRVTGNSVSGLQDEIVWGLRLPRVLLAAVVGAGLSAAGVVLQAVVRNPLADPYVLGVSAGASCGAVLVLTAGTAAGATAGGASLLTGLGVSVAAFAGALVALGLVLVLGQRQGVLEPTRLVLAGVALGYLLTAITSFLQLRATPSQLVGVLFWLLGSVSGATWTDLGTPTVAVAAALVFLLLHHRHLNALLMGDESATSLGVNVRRLRLSLLVVASLLTGLVVAVAGGVGFVGLVVPHAVRLVVGPDHRILLPASVLTGATFLVLVDLAARTVDAPNELPLGIFTAVLGAPFFLWLLRRRPSGGTG